MTSIKEIADSVKPELESMNALIRERLHSSNPLMNKVVEGYLESKGKQIRPLLVILTAKLFGKVNQYTINVAASVEMLHNATLIHDDVVDNSQLRRNTPTINSVWDNHIAVLVGDFFVSTSLGLAAETGDWRTVGILARLGRQLSMGELDQICNARYHSFAEERYFNVINHKTASLFESCVEMGASSVNAGEAQEKAISRFANRLGLCFQIRDDIFDYIDTGEVGKPTGNDLREGKVTLPLLHALGCEKHPDCKAMREIVEKENLSDEEIGRLIAFAIDAGGVEYAYSVMEKLYAEAVAELNAIEGADSEVRDTFASILRFVISRKN